MNKWITISLLGIVALTGCSKKEQTLYPSASPCVLIKRKMDAVYPSQVATRQTATQEAQLFREYEYYRCGDVSEIKQ